jgi:hypothetical protein
MSEGLSTDLWFAFAVTLVFGFVILAKRFPVNVAIPIALVKAGIPFVYFAFYFDGTWTFYDDIRYLQTANFTLHQGYDPFTMFFSLDGRLALPYYTQSTHFAYFWVNMVALRLFGNHYFAPVFFNVCLTYIAGVYLYRFARSFGMTVPYTKGLVLFFLVHWDILTWTSLLNLKEMVVLLFTLIMIHHLTQFATGNSRGWRKFLDLLIVGAAALVLAATRFYAPLIVFTAYFLWLLMHRRGLYGLLIASTAICLAIVAFTSFRAITEEMQVVTSPGGLLTGLAMVHLSPPPWATGDTVGFLTIAVTFHWLFLVPALWGAQHLWKRNPGLRIAILYVGVAWAFYAIVIDLRGPRERVQLTFIWAWFQYHFLVCAYNTWLQWRNERLQTRDLKQLADAN